MSVVDAESYEIRYNPKTGRCNYCLKNQNGCVYERKRKIYASCSSENKDIGLGLKEYPLNLMRSKEIDWD